MHGDPQADAPDGPTPARRRTDILSTYRHLRLAMVSLLVLLGIAVADASYPMGELCFEGSISAYYFTPARAVFIGVLCALGACLIVYRGKTDHEDVALNISGALAFVVAFVPTSPPTSDRLECTKHHVPDFVQLNQAIDNNIRAYFVVAAASLALTFYATGGRRAPEVSDDDAAKSRAIQRTGHWLLLGLLVAGIAAFGLWPEGFRDRAHSVAAVLMFVGILVVVLFNAVRIKDPDRVGSPPRAPSPPATRGRRRIPIIRPEKAGTVYLVLTCVMAVSIVLTLVLHLTLDQWRYSILVMEAVLLVEFLVFWVVQTSELWLDDSEPPAPVPASATPDLTEAGQA